MNRVYLVETHDSDDAGNWTPLRILSHPANEIRERMYSLCGQLGLPAQQIRWRRLKTHAEVHRHLDNGCKVFHE